LKTVTPAELKKLIRASGAGGFFGFKDRFFDESFHIPEPEDAKKRMADAVQKVSGRGLIPEETYAENGSDCENFAKWYQAEVTMQWAVEHIGQRSYPAYAIAFLVVPGHGINMAATTEGLLFWNFGTLIDWDAKEIKEVEIY